ncbi:MAG: tetratricopeptide repeat protein [Acidobacteriia bacterium]|nr:tetratricopeptide repeat protein [Terriglobia bacterium]
MIHRNRWRISVLLTLVFCSPVLAQGAQPRPQGMSISIHGQLRFAEGGVKAENILVRLETQEGGVVAEVRTDRNGKFDFSGITQAMYRVTATMEGYLPAYQEVNLMTTYTEYVLLTLVPDRKKVSVPKSETTEILLDSKVPKEAQDEYEKGRSELLNASDPVKGIPHLEKAVKIYPHFVEAQLLLGTAYLDSHQLDKAQATLLQVLKIAPKTAQANFALGEVYREKKDFPAAEKTLLEGLKLDDKSWQGHLELGRVYWEIGDIPKSGVEAGKTLQLKPDCTDGLLLAGNLLLRAHKPTEALGMFQEYLRLDPKGKYADQTKNLVGKIKNALAEEKK